MVVDSPHFHVHRCATQTELINHGPKSSNQLSRLKGLLKDEPHRYALRNPGLAMQTTPALSVVLNPSVDTAAHVGGGMRAYLHTARTLQQEEARPRGFIPGPYTQHSWMLERNRIPVHDYQHDKFREKKGQDFK